MPPVGGLWNIEWLNENSQRNYPLSSEATRTDVTGAFTLPNDLLVDFLLPIQASPDIDPTKFHISRVTIFSGGVTLSFSYDGTTMGSTTIASAGFVTNSVYTVTCVGDFEDVIGKATIGSLDNIEQSAGSYEFDLAGGRLETAVIRPNLRGIASIRVQSGESLSKILQGDVIIQGGSNCTIQVIKSEGEVDRLVISAISGANLAAACGCNENQELVSIKTINGVPPNTLGQFTLQGDDCLELKGETNGITIEDKCSKPCCGCDELNVITTTVDRMLQQVVALEHLGARLEAAITSIGTNLTASKLNASL